MKLSDLLKEYELTIEESNSSERKPIDFTIRDGDDQWCAEVWGEDPKSVEVECDHPYQCIDWGDDDECGECELCGAQCYWRWENDGDGGQERNIYKWERPERVGGLVKKYLKSLEQE